MTTSNPPSQPPSPPPLLVSSSSITKSPSSPPTNRFRSLACAVIWGQIISLVVAASNVFLKLLVERKKVQYSFFQNALGYGLISIVFGILNKRRKGDDNSHYEPVAIDTNDATTTTTTSNQPLSWRRIAVLIFIAILDSLAGYSDVVAYQFGESISSLGLMASFTIPSSMFFSYILLHSRFTLRHFVGVFLSMFGMALVIFIDAQRSSDSTTTTSSSANLKWAGDLLVLLGSATYALDNVLSERILKNSMDWRQYLFYLGSFGFLVSLIASLATEWSEVEQIPIFTDVVVDAYLLAYAISFLAAYGLIAKYFIVYDAVAMNLSLLTTSLWGAVCDFVLFNDLITATTLFGFLFIVAGVTLYHTKGQGGQVEEEENASPPSSHDVETNSEEQVQ